MIEQPTSPFEVSTEGWKVLEAVSEQAGCEPLQYVEDGIMIAIIAAQAILENRAAGKLSTGLLIGDNEGGYVYGDLTDMLTTDSDDFEQSNIGIEDPFIEEGKLPLRIDSSLNEEVAEVCDHLVIEPYLFIRSAISLRRQLQLAHDSNRAVLIETAAADDYLEIPTSFTDIR